MESGTEHIKNGETGEILKDIGEFIELSKRFMQKLDLLKATSMPPQYVNITKDAAIKVGEKAFLYLCKTEEVKN